MCLLPREEIRMIRYHAYFRNLKFDNGSLQVGNQLSGTLPRLIFGCPGCNPLLQIFDASRNRLTGSLPVDYIAGRSSHTGCCYLLLSEIIKPIFSDFSPQQGHIALLYDTLNKWEWAIWGLWGLCKYGYRAGKCILERRKVTQAYTELGKPYIYNTLAIPAESSSFNEGVCRGIINIDEGLTPFVFEQVHS